VPEVPGVPDSGDGGLRAANMRLRELLAERDARIAEQAADELAMMPFIRFDLLDARPIRTLADALPMTTIRVAGGQLARIRSLQLADEFCARVDRHSRGL